jgi:hypothetical protein
LQTGALIHSIGHAGRWHRDCVQNRCPPACLFFAPASRRAVVLPGDERHFAACRHHGARLRITIILVAASLASLAPAGVSGQTGSAASGRVAAVAIAQPPERSVVGTLDAVDPKTMQIVVGSAAGKQTLHLQDGATIRQGSKTVKPADLPAHKGERVKVRYRESGGVRQAEWIVLASPPARHGKAAGKT